VNDDEGSQGSEDEVKCGEGRKKYNMTTTRAGMLWKPLFHFPKIHRGFSKIGRSTQTFSQKKKIILIQIVLCKLHPRTSTA